MPRDVIHIDNQGERIPLVRPTMTQVAQLCDTIKTLLDEETPDA